MEAEGEADTPTQEGIIIRDINKPGSCPLRKTKPKGPIKGCEETCWAFKSCIEHTRNEREFEEWQTKEIERRRAHV